MAMANIAAGSLLSRITDNNLISFGLINTASLVSIIEHTFYFSNTLIEFFMFLLEVPSICSYTEGTHILQQILTFISQRGIRLELGPTNPVYPPRIYSPAEIESLPVQIIGVVVELRRKIK